MLLRAINAIGVLVKISEKECPCSKLTMTRWDIYICDDCGRQLAFLEPTPIYPCVEFNIIDAFKRLFRRENN